MSTSRPALGTFSTPGFQVTKALPIQTRHVVYVSSDSAPSTPGPVKRTSSGASVVEEVSPHPPKRQKKVSDEKENVLTTSSKVNSAIPRAQQDIKHYDLDAVRIIFISCNSGSHIFLGIAGHTGEETAVGSFARKVYLRSMH